MRTIIRDNHKGEIHEIVNAKIKVQDELKYIALQCAHLYAATGERDALTLASVAEQQRDFLLLQCTPWFKFPEGHNET